MTPRWLARQGCSDTDGASRQRARQWLQCYAPALKHMQSTCRGAGDFYVNIFAIRICTGVLAKRECVDRKVGEIRQI